MHPPGAGPDHRAWGDLIPASPGAGGGVWREIEGSERIGKFSEGQNLETREACLDGTTGLSQSQALEGVGSGEEGNLESVEEGASKHACSSGLDPGQDPPCSPCCAAVAGSVRQRK